MDSKAMPVVFTPDNEPYLGRTLLVHFDQLISSVMEQNAVTAPTSHGRELGDHQRMACQVIPQAYFPHEPAGKTCPFEDH